MAALRRAETHPRPHFVRTGVADHSGECQPQGKPAITDDKDTHHAFRFDVWRGFSKGAMALSWTLRQALRECLLP